MLDLSEITRRAKDTPRQTTDVDVVFDVGLTTELGTLREELEKLQDEAEQIDADLDTALAELEQDRRASDPRPAAVKKQAEKDRARLAPLIADVEQRIGEVEERAAEYLVTFRFTALLGFEWNDLCAHSTPREGVEADQQRGYNTDEVAKIAAARGGTRLDDDGNPIAVSSEQWTAVWETLPALEWASIKQRIFTLNEFSTFAARAEAVNAARKASAARQAATPDSPSTSGSTPDASPAGNPPRRPTTSTTSKAA